MPTSLIMAAVSTASVALGLSAPIFGLSLVGHFLVTTAMGAALNALSPKPNLGNLNNASRGYSIGGESGAALDHQIIYGRVRAGGVRIYDASTGGNNDFLHRILAFAGHEIESYDEIYLNDEIVTLDGSGNVTSPARYNGFVRIKRYFGTTTQTADPDLVSDTISLVEGQWTTNHRLQGIAYLYVRFKYSADVFPNGVPGVSATIKGRKVLDTRTSTTAWSDNPALCLNDYLTSAFGMNQATTKVFTTAVNTAANICDEVVDSEKRYTCNGSFVTSFTPSQVISDLLTSMGGLLWYSQGKWRMKAAKFVTPTVTLNESDLRSGISLSTRHSRRSNFNTVKGKFKGAETNWQEADYPSISDPLFVSNDNGIVNTLDLALPFTTSSKTAQRIANIALRRNREQLTFSASFGLKAFQVEVGDFVYVNNARFGWVNKEFEVTNWNFGLTEGLDLQVQMTLREISTVVFTNQPASLLEGNNTNLPSPFYTEAVGITMSGEVRVINESLTDVIKATINATRPANVERVEVQFKKTTDTVWTTIGVGDLGTYEAIVVDPNETYDFRARSYSFLGVKSDWFTVNAFQPVGLAAPPSDVTNFRANLNGGNINFEWNPVPDLDLSYYLIRHALEETGATFANSTTAIEKVSRPGTTATIPTRPGTYSIRAYDKSGNQSVNSTSFVIPATALETFTNNLTLTNSPTFAGTKTGCFVTNNELQLLSTSFITTAASGTGTTATLTFATQASPPFAVGSRITITGVTPAGYNGTFVVTACTTTTVSYASTATGAQTVAGIVRLAPATITTGASGTGSTATLTFATQATIPYPVGSSITVSGVTPSSYNGTFVVTACTTSSVSYASAATGSQTVAGTIFLSSGTYQFTTHIDTGAVRRVRSRIDVNVNRVDAASGLFDGVPGLFDNLPGLFDDLTGGTQFADANVLTYISITQQDPAGTPTWSEWQLFKAGDFFGRAFRYKIDLVSKTSGVTPSVSGLTARVQY